MGVVRSSHDDKPNLHKEDEKKYVLTFRGQVGRRLTAEEEGRRPMWFEQIKDSIADFGNRVGQVRAAGGGPARSDELSGYIVINADSLDGAAAVAGGCPILQQGGSVEIGNLTPGRSQSHNARSAASGARAPSRSNTTTS
ncbi:MAG: hypothetical protein JO168_22475 [Solirubrobacterales bacterium]|nr:hypothetical protein [Solirubrobacterales bacterium]